MENLFNRYRNFTTLILVLFAQLILLAYQVKGNKDVPFFRVWTVTAVTPIATVMEDVRSGVSGFFQNYFTLRDVRSENKRMREEMGRLKLENQFLKTQLSTADRAKALAAFETQSQSRMLAARIIGTGTGANNKVVFIDRGSNAGVQKGMGVVTPDGIVGKVLAAYPTASQVLLVTDPDFAAGVVTEKGQVHGTLKGQGTPQCKVDYVAFEEKVEPGEWVYTSGDDRIFPRGFRVGVVKAVRPGQPFKEILVEPSGMERGLEDVLILIEGVHQRIPDAPSGMQPIYIASPPPGSESKPADAAAPAPLGTEADRLRAQYQTLGEEQKHTYGENPPGAKPPDFTKLANPGAAGGYPLGPAGKSTPSPAGAPPNAGAGKSPPSPAGAPAKNPPDAVRRLNQSAGPSAGGQLR